MKKQLKKDAKLASMIRYNRNEIKKRRKAIAKAERAKAKTRRAVKEGEIQL